MHYLNTQEFDVNPTTDIQNAQQTTSVDSTVSTREGWFMTSSEEHYRYPLRINYSLLFNADGSATQVTSVLQADHVRSSGYDHGPWDRTLDNEVKTTDTLLLSPSFSVTGNTGAQSTQSYRTSDSGGGCYSRTIASRAQKLTAVNDGRGCGGEDQQH